MNFVSEKIENYCIDFSQEVPTYLNELERATHMRTLAPQMLSGRLLGRFLSFISAMVQPNCIVEIGTFTGYSSLCLAEGLQTDGILHTFEVDDELLPTILEFHKLSPYEDKITVHIGAAEDLLPPLDIVPDLAFLDAGKTNYSNHYEILLDKMQPGGIILVDNVLWSGKVVRGDKDTGSSALQQFNKKIARDERCQQVMIPLRDGLTLLRKK